MRRFPTRGRDLSETTETIDLRGPAASARATRPGLVLVYAEEYAALAPAYPLDKREVLIGRDPDADIHIPSSAVSRHHARIHQQGDRFLLTDLGGRNGSIVNGEAAREVALRPHDVIRFGDAIFTFVAQGAEGFARYRIDGAVVDPETGAARPGGGAGRIVGGYQIQSIAAGLKKVAKSDLAVVLLGESGTGKEVFAEQLHDWSGRRGPLLMVNCSAIPATLIEGELFGHKRGAFSGADRDRVGLIRAAHGGTLFLDEIGDMPLEAQAKLLRVLQSKELTPLGATQPERVDLRVVCATHRDLGEMQEAGTFRRDLFARLNEYSVLLPPLRARKEDLYILCMALLARHGEVEAQFTLPFMAGISEYDFPYNVRELETLMKRFVAMGGGQLLDERALSDEIKLRRPRSSSSERRPDAPPDAPQARQREVARSSGTAGSAGAAGSANAASSANTAGGGEVLPRGFAATEEKLREALAQHRGNIAAVARALGRDRAQIHRWVNRYSINVDDYR